MSVSNNIITIEDQELAEFFKTNVKYNPRNLLLHAVNEAKNNKLDKIDITRDDVILFYQEYQNFQNHKKNILNTLNENLKQYKLTLNRMKFTELETFFTAKLNIKQETHSCNFCGFSCSTVKGLTTHKRGCTKNPDAKPKTKKRDKQEDKIDVIETGDDNSIDSEEQDED